MYLTLPNPMKPADSKRIEDLILRLTQRNKHCWAARIYGGWIARPSSADRGEAPPTALEWIRFGRLLRNAGNVGEAIDAFRKSVLVTMHTGGRPEILLHTALREFADSLDSSGEKKSAAETRTLRERLVAAAKADEDPFKTLPPADVIAPAVSRCSFIMSIEWESLPHTQQSFEQNGMIIFRDRLRLDGNSDTWFVFEIQAPAGQDPSYPHVAVCIKFPWEFSTPLARQSALEIVNAMNLDNAATSACLEPDTGQVAIRARVAFTGFHQGAGSLADFSTAQFEITVNLVAEIISTASGWQSRVEELCRRIGDSQPAGAAVTQA